MTDFVSQAAQIGTVSQIPNDLASQQFDTAILTDPLQIQAYKADVAGQLNKQSGGPRFNNLQDRIAGIRIETAAQGASILVLSIIDPSWVLPCSGFIETDEFGYLWPPIDLNFPRGTDCMWRLCQYHATWDADMTEPNLTLTFEDRIVSILREMSPAHPGGLSHGQPNQTLGGFIKSLVDNANHNLKTNIRLVELISPRDPNYTVPINDIPSSAQKDLHPQPVRQNPLKQIKGLSRSQQAVLSVANSVSNSLKGLGDSLFGTGEQVFEANQLQLAGDVTLPGQ